MTTASSFTIQNFLKQGITQKNAETELIPFPQNMVQQLDPVTFQLNTGFSAPTRNITNFVSSLNVAVFIVVWWDLKNKQSIYIKEANFTSQPLRFVIPSGIVDQGLDYAVLIGYSNGVLGGYTLPSYLTRIAKSFFYYKYAYTSPAKFDYHFAGTKTYNKRILIEYTPEEQPYLVIGGGWTIGDGHTIGDVVSLKVGDSGWRIGDSHSIGGIS